jgi:outer membrane protein assembly factor BamD
MRKFFLLLPLLFLVLSCHRTKAVIKAPTSTLDEPDRVLFERAGRDMEKNRFTVARLTLQTLINTYPDSEYLPQAKYMMAESFYREESSSSLTQAEIEFKDYITFFPITPLAEDAQMKIAMTHIRRLEKADRDNTQARLAEVELQSLIQTYPDSKLLAEAKQKLRAIQDVLADADAGVGNQYFKNRAYLAAMRRYKEVVTKYPDYSKMPETLFNLAESLRQIGNDPESAPYYERIVVEHPLSSKAVDAKRRLTAMNLPIPEPNPVALARAQQENRDDNGVLGKFFGMLRSRPPVPTDTAAASTAAAEEQPTDTAPAPVRGGVGAGTNGNTGAGNGGNGSFSIDPAKVNKASQPPKKP